MYPMRIYKLNEVFFILIRLLVSYFELVSYKAHWGILYSELPVCIKCIDVILLLFPCKSWQLWPYVKRHIMEDNVAWRELFISKWMTKKHWYTKVGIHFWLLLPNWCASNWIYSPEISCLPAFCFCISPRFVDNMI